MRDYAKITPQFWIGETGREMRRHGLELRVVATYLLSAPSSNMLGLYYLPIHTIAYETGIPFEGVSKALQRGGSLGFCSYDQGSECVWVHEMARIQIGDTFKPNDNRCVGVQREYDALPNNPYLGPFFEKYAASYHMTKRRDFKPLRSPIEGPSEPLGSQEQEQEQDQEQEQEQDTRVTRLGFGTKPVALNAPVADAPVVSSWKPGAPITSNEDLLAAASAWRWANGLREGHKAALRRLVKAGAITPDESREARDATNTKRPKDRIAFFLGVVDGIRADVTRIDQRDPSAPPAPAAPRPRGFNPFPDEVSHGE